MPRCCCCCRRRADERDSFKFADTDGNICHYAFVRGQIQRTFENSDKIEVIDQLYHKKDDDGRVLVGDTIVNLSEFPLHLFQRLEEFAKNAGTAFTNLDSVARTGAPPLRQGGKGQKAPPPYRGPLRLFLHRAFNVPEMDSASANDTYVTIEVFGIENGERKVLAKARSNVLDNIDIPVWNQTLELPSPAGPHSMVQEVEPSSWDINNTEVKFTMHEKDTYKDDFIGECSLPLREAIEREKLDLLLWDKNTDPVVGRSPHMPTELSVRVDPQSFPATWPRPSQEHRRYPCHVFMMTRGTRGDVQPFVALARGMAEKLGWLVTICTEVRWKNFVKQSAADVNKNSDGRIRFRPSGGDTEGRMSKPMAQWALTSKTEFLQMTMLAHSEAEFFPSATVFLRQVQICSTLEKDQPVDFLIFGLTVAQIAALISEKLSLPLAGFILQPSCIPSDYDTWKAVQDIRSHYFSWIDELEKGIFTGHKSLAAIKYMAENNWWTALSMTQLREYFALPPMPKSSVWELFALGQTPLVIPIKEGSFQRPPDWWDSVQMTDFIFLRTKKEGARELGKEIGTFVESARAANAKICLMTFSSMPVPRKTMLTCAVKMVEECQFNMRLIYVGSRQKDDPPASLLDRAKKLTDAGRFLEVGSADFGVLFDHIDCFVVHGGLGTTVEALRQKKPCTVTGPLVLDQRFWGGVCFDRGVGMNIVHIDEFSSICVEFADAALDPFDAKGFQAKAKMEDWGSGDGVEGNVQCFQELWEQSEAKTGIENNNMLRPFGNWADETTSGVNPLNPV